MTNGSAGSGKVLEVASGDEIHFAARQHLHLVIGDVLKQALEIQGIAGNEECDDLSRTVARKLVTIGKPGDDSPEVGTAARRSNRVSRWNPQGLVWLVMRGEY